MKLIIAGGRHYQLTQADLSLLDAIHRANHVTLVLSGAATGADQGGEQWAASRGIPVQRHPYMSEYGKAGGPMRNAKMAAEGEALCLFPGGRGSANMLKEAQKNGLIIFQSEHFTRSISNRMTAQ